jgi:O-antigen ligase
MVNAAGKIVTILIVIAVAGIVFLVQPRSLNVCLPKDIVCLAAGALCALVLGLRILKGNRFGNGLPLPLLLTASAAVAYTAIRTILQNAGAYPLLDMWVLISLFLISICVAVMLDRSGRDIIVWTLAVCVSAVGILVFLDRMLPGMNFLESNITVSGRPSGPLGNPNLLGSLMAASLFPVAGLLWSRKWKILPRLLSIAAGSSVMVGVILLTRTRSSLTGLAAGAFFLAAFLYCRKRKFLPGWLRKTGPVLLIVLLLIGMIALIPSFRQLGSASQNSLAVRQVIWSGTIRMFMEKPLTGWGPGAFQTIFPLFRDPMYNLIGAGHNTAHAHSEYLELLSEMGIPGLLAALSVILLFFRTAMRKARDAVGIGLLCGVAVLLAEAATSVALRWPSSAFMLALFAGLALVAEGRSADRLPRLLSIVPLGVSLMLVMSVIPLALKVNGSEMRIFEAKMIYLDGASSAIAEAQSSAEQWEQTGNRGELIRCADLWSAAGTFCDSAVVMCLESLEFCPDNTGAWYTLGNAYMTASGIAFPAEPVLRSILIEYGLPIGTDRLDRMLHQARAAFDSLSVRAPYFAEMHHNNVYLSYSLGRIGETIQMLETAFPFFGHYKTQYEYMHLRLSPFSTCPACMRVSISIGMRRIQKMYENEGIGSDHALMQRHGVLILTGLYCHSFPDRVDSICGWFTSSPELDVLHGGDELRTDILVEAGYTDEAIEVIGRFERGDTTGLLELCSSSIEIAAVPLPYHQYVAGTLAARRGDREGVEMLADLNQILIWNASAHPSGWPGGGESFRSEGLLALRCSSGFEPDLVIGAAETMLFTDLILYLALSTAESMNPVEEEQILFDSIMSIWVGIGGVNAAHVVSRGNLLVENGYLVELISELRNEPADADSVDKALLGLRLYYVLYTSLYWSGGIPDTEAIMEAACAIDSCRLFLEKTLGSRNAGLRIEAVLTEDHARIRGFLPDHAIPLMENVMYRITEGMPVAD